jgi:protein-S-isoprenylcysteine O-methyltransferase Ste14
MGTPLNQGRAPRGLDGNPLTWSRNSSVKFVPPGERVGAGALDQKSGLPDFCHAIASRRKECSTVMPKYLGALTIVLLLGMVLTRVFLLRRQGVQAMRFGETHRSDFLLPPFAFFYFYVIFAAAFGWPSVTRQEFFHSETMAWTGVLVCAAALLLVLWSLASFRRSFRIGIDTERPDSLVTDGAFAVSRNPIYVAFIMMTIGQFLIFPNVVLLIYIGGAAAVIHHQIRREEEFLRGHYGEAYAAYCARVRRYL